MTPAESVRKLDAYERETLERRIERAREVLEEMRGPAYTAEECARRGGVLWEVLRMVVNAYDPDRKVNP